MTTDPRMSVEVHQLVERLEMAERGSRGWKTIAVLALLVSIVALLLPLLRTPSPSPAPPTRARFTTVETERLVLRDRDGTAAGGLEVDARGTIRLVLGRPGGGAAFLEAQQDGISHLRLRGADGGVRAALVGGDRPAATLSPDGRGLAVSLGTSASGTGSIQVTDAAGRPRFRAP